MSNENKTALTAEEILIECLNGRTLYLKTFKYCLNAMRSFASLQKDKEIEELKAQRMVDAECISQSGAYRIESTKQLESLQSQLSEVTKERDELREGVRLIYYQAHQNNHTFYEYHCKQLLTPTKEERKEGECNSQNCFVSCQRFKDCKKPN